MLTWINGRYHVNVYLLKKSLARDHLELFGAQFWVVEMNNQAYSLLQQSALHVSTLEIQFHSCTSSPQSSIINV